MNDFKILIVEDVPLELKGTEGLVRTEIPEAKIIGTASNEMSYWQLMKEELPDLVLLDLGLGGSTTIGIEICRHTKELHPQIKILIFTGEILNEKLWVDALDAGADGIILKCGEMLTRNDVLSIMQGKRMVFNQPILQRLWNALSALLENKQSIATHSSTMR
jgi:DNA-binding NarL/FixJ family response regulator